MTYAAVIDPKVIDDYVIPTKPGYDVSELLIKKVSLEETPLPDTIIWFGLVDIINPLSVYNVGGYAPVKIYNGKRAKKPCRTRRRGKKQKKRGWTKKQRETERKKQNGS